MPDFSTVTETGHGGGSVSVGPGIVEAFVVGSGVGTVVGAVVGIIVGVGVATGSDGEKQPATQRRTAARNARQKGIWWFINRTSRAEYFSISVFKKNQEPFWVF